MERTFLEEGEVAMCEICSKLCERKKQHYEVCPDHHVTCVNCLQAHTFKTHCPICGKPFRKGTRNKGERLIEMLTWEDVMKPKQEDKDQVTSNFEAQGHLQPRQRESSGADFTMELAHTFDQFYHPQESSFAQVKIKTRGYLTLLSIQVVFTIFNFYFGLERVDDVACPNRQNQHQVMTYQSWLMGVAIIELVFLAFSLLFVLFYKYRCVNPQEFKSCWKIVKTLFGIKILLWGIIQIIIFLRGIPEHCAKGLQIFGMVNAIVHVLMLSAVLAEFGKLRKKLLFIVIQLYVSFFNVYYGFENTEELTSEPSYREDLHSYQTWLKWLGLFEFFFVVSVTLYYKLKTSTADLPRLGYLLLLVYAAQLLVWLSVQIYMLIFNRQILQNCTSGMYFYCICTLILNILLLVFACFWRIIKK